MVPKDIVSAACIVLNDEDKILLIKGPKRGWEMPGGQVELDEPLYDAAIREVKEESGADIEITRFCGIFQNTKSSIFNTLFLARYIGGTLQTSDESLEVGFFTYDEVMNMVTWKNFKKRFEYCLNRTEPFVVSF
ncbi:NUDIX hydrolase [Mammaliicoccus sciuri]|uniref:NUDIX hydrolase n=1 Tax=Mammaliicoccus sciuri TaxID=1296 RepID=UPI001C3E81E5|nr:NUDIX domain-containing protein [Mammaliicoccus sciuri]MBV5103922.1 NUDIX domain-containing protein [Mammaliicoccus sciuri]MEB5789664.1 NUDIX domain-containing protein [Mammaliicoccus sciuri]